MVLGERIKIGCMKYQKVHEITSLNKHKIRTEQKKKAVTKRLKFGAGKGHEIHVLTTVIPHFTNTG